LTILGNRSAPVMTKLIDHAYSPLLSDASKPK
jgi:hypothetical protein